MLERLKREALTFPCASTVKVNLLTNTGMGAGEGLADIVEAVRRFFASLTRSSVQNDNSFAGILVRAKRSAVKAVILKRETLTFQCASTVKVNLLTNTRISARASANILEADGRFFTSLRLREAPFRMTSLFPASLESYLKGKVKLARELSF